jgi:hypothetical protein
MLRNIKAQVRYRSALRSRLPEYLFSGKYKHWNAKRDGEQQPAEWHASLYENAQRMGLDEKTFVPSKGDVLIWSADLAHGGSPVSDPSLTRRSYPARPGVFVFENALRANRSYQRSSSGPNESGDPHCDQHGAGRTRSTGEGQVPEAPKPPFA